MKLIKKITAATTALVMAVGMMSMGASADSVSQYLHYNKYAPTSESVVSKSENVRVTSLVQTIKLTQFDKPTGSSASVSVYNRMSSKLTATFNQINQEVSHTFTDINVLGTLTNVGSSLNNYVSASSVNVTCEFKC